MVFAVHFASRQFYAHKHIIDGIAIAHSHFHTNTHNDTDCGGHTKETILFIERMAQVDCTNVSNIDVPNPTHFFSHLNKYIEEVRWIASIHLNNPTLRAPPVI